MDDDFKTVLIETIEKFSKPENLFVKNVIGSDFPKILKTLFELFENDELPKVETVFNAIKNCPSDKNEIKCKEEDINNFNIQTDKQLNQKQFHLSIPQQCA